MATKQRIENSPSDPRHGTLNGYSNLKCRCVRCKAAWSSHWRDYYATNLNARRHRTIRLHGITVEQYDALLAKQGNRCAACGSAFRSDGFHLRFDIDHDHAHCPGGAGCPDCIRGLLCNRCNKTLGLVGDDPSVLADLIAYLEKSPRT